MYTSEGEKEYIVQPGFYLLRYCTAKEEVYEFSRFYAGVFVPVVVVKRRNGNVTVYPPSFQSLFENLRSVEEFLDTFSRVCFEIRYGKEDVKQIINAMIHTLTRFAHVFPAETHELVKEIIEKLRELRERIDI